MTATFARLRSACAVALLAASAALPAQAAVILGSNFTDGGSAPATIGGLSWTIAPAGSTFELKTAGGYTGVGISGKTNDEIDIGEFLTGTAVSGTFSVTKLMLGVLFNGPEFGDVNEVAQVTIGRFGGATASYRLTATGDTTATWTGVGAPINRSAATSNGAGVWELVNPFGSINDIVSISFTALSGKCPLGQSCSNQSDFTLVKLVTNEVPEPGVLALLGLGLIGAAAVRRRQRG